MSQTLTEFLSQFLTSERLQRFDEILQFRTRHLTVVLENIYHAHNASACLRTCDCFGIQDVHVIEAVNAFEPNQEISLGASQWLTLHRYTAFNEDSGPDFPNAAVATQNCLQTLKSRGYQVLATSPRQDSVPIDEISVQGRTALVLGSEQRGVSRMAMNEADQLVHIPMFGFTESFNISVTVAILLRHFTMKLHDSTAAWQLSEEERRELLLEWISKSLGDKLEPLKRRYNGDST